MAERDAILQLSRQEAQVILRSLQATQDILQITADMVPTSGQVVEDRLQHLSKVRQVMIRVRDAPPLVSFYPNEIGGVAMINWETHIIESWGPSLEALFGYTYDDAVGTPAFTLFRNDESLARKLHAQLKEEGELQVPLKLKSKRGEQLDCMVYGQMVYLQCEGRHGSEHVLCHVWLI